MLLIYVQRAPTAQTIGTRINVLLAVCMLIPSCLGYDHLNHPQVMLRSKTCHLFLGNNFGRFLGKPSEIILWSLPHRIHYSTRKTGDGLLAWEPMHWGLFVKNIFSTEISMWLGIEVLTWGKFGYTQCFFLPYISFLSVGIVQVKNRNKHKVCW